MWALIPRIRVVVVFLHLEGAMDSKRLIPSLLKDNSLAHPFLLRSGLNSSICMREVTAIISPTFVFECESRYRAKWIQQLFVFLVKRVTNLGQNRKSLNKTSGHLSENQLRFCLFLQWKHCPCSPTIWPSSEPRRRDSRKRCFYQPLPVGPAVLIFCHIHLV
jgi:hypothetical protein